MIAGPSKAVEKINEVIGGKATTVQDQCRKIASKGLPYFQAGSGPPGFLSAFQERLKADSQALGQKSEEVAEQVVDVLEETVKSLS